jgi:HPt (histidine-containing phosphotransfer) domain-containing protein
MSKPTTATNAPIRSEFASDPDFQDILVGFAQAISERRQLMAELHSAGSVDELGRQAHQLKGAGGGYGFPQVSTTSAELERACRAKDAPEIDRCLAELLDVLGRVKV